MENTNENPCADILCHGTTDRPILAFTGKKREYASTQIKDKKGEYRYLEDPEEYKKARKRQQNRESAFRSRKRKQKHQDKLEGQLDEKEQLLENACAERDMWKSKFAAVQAVARQAQRNRNPKVRRAHTVLHASRTGRFDHRCAYRAASKPSAHLSSPTAHTPPARYPTAHTPPAR